MVAAAAALEPDRIDAAWKRIRQRELQIVLPSGIDHVVVVKLQRAILIGDFSERVAASIPVAPGDTPLNAVDQARRRASREIRLDRLGCAITCADGLVRCSVGESILPLKDGSGDPDGPMPEVASNSLPEVTVAAVVT